MSGPPSLVADSVASLLAASAEGPPRVGDERLDSLEVATLISQVETKWGVELALDDEQLAQMSTVSSATDVLVQAIAGRRHG